ncbi:SMI1/KNR4 family protein [Pleionea sp. CnH1-48]|uniref:SMI1/KNR4 family protein n=1 Tax=Pleionea sp. CnH1-48 TaxID=2954494 RepID=UPI0020983EFE|nr:SMI1/KNR4 family protein [Pleionea sp. CnH1-48]MCO7225684.1 SMI1/KNR4 family protein [Pleionea sp. CnH1-48]
MNEIVDMLREKNEDRFSSVELPDLDLLVEIEEEIFIPLPKEFKDFLMSVSDVVYGSIEPVTVSDDALHTHLPDVAAEAWDIGVSRELIPICRQGSNYYCITQTGEIVFWQHGDIDSAQEWDSIWEWVEEVWLGQ